MKIVQVIPYFCFGGAETMCENLSYALRKLGNEVLVISLYDRRTPISQRMEQAGIRIVYLDKKLGLDFSMVGKIAAVLRQEKPDVVHTHLNTIKYAVAAARLSGVKTCVHTVHNVAQQEAEGKVEKIIRNFYFTRGWSVPVGLSPAVQETISQFYKLEKSQIPVIYNGIDLSHCIPKKDYSLGQTITLLHIGRFTQQKNHVGLLRAFAGIVSVFPRSRLNLVGEGELRETVEAEAARMGLRDRVRFLGSQSNVYPFLHQADVFLLPSEYEGMPMTLIEAMGTGLPIVATRVGGVPDMLTDGTSAILTPCDPDAVARACVSVLEREDLRRNLGQAALEQSVRFSAGFMAQQYVKVYKSKISPEKE